MSRDGNSGGAFVRHDGDLSVLVFCFSVISLLDIVVYPIEVAAPLVKEVVPRGREGMELSRHSTRKK